jgi:hypothetical protein
MRAGRLPFLMFVFVLIGLLAGLSACTVADPDLWGHVRFGQDILAAGHVIRSDPYSFTSGQAWTNHEWLAEIIMAGAYRLGGVRGLVALSSGVAALVLLLAGRLLRRSGVGQPATLVLLVALFIGIAPQLMVVRPQLFSVFLFTLMLMILSGSERRREEHLLWLALLFALWANLHGGWIVGLGIVGLWVGVGVVTRRVSWKWCAAAVAVSIGGSAINPYGWGLWVFLWQTVGLGRADITEWQSLFAQPAGFIQWVVGAIVVGVGWRRRSAFDALRFIPTVALGLLAIKAVRLDCFFVLAAVVMLGPLWAGLGPARLPLSRRPALSELAVVALMAITGVAIVAHQTLRATTCLPVESESGIMPEREAVAFMRSNGLHGRLLTGFNYGEYAIWHLAPQLRVSFDGRRETVYSDRVKDAHLQFYNGLNLAYPDEIGADYIWLPNQLPVVHLLPKYGWVPIFKGPRSIIFARAPGFFHNVAPLSGPRCFPGP